MLAEYDPAHPDENVAYYLAKLDALYEKFRPFVDRNGLFDTPEPESVSEAASTQSNLFAPSAELGDDELV